jgi:hypothetical protein
LEQRLIEEVQTPEVTETYSKIQALQQEAERKQKAVERLEEQIKGKDDEAKRLRQEAERCLGRGEDPVPVLDKAVELENQAENMRGILPGGHSRPDAEEQDQIKELRRQFDGALRRAIVGSQLGEEVQAEFEKKLQELKDLTERWNQALQATGQSFGSRERGNPLKVQDPALQQFARETLGNLRGPRV